MLMVENEKKEEELEKLRKRVMNVDPTLNEKYGLKIKELEDVKNEKITRTSTVEVNRRKCKTD